MNAAENKTLLEVKMLLAEVQVASEWMIKANAAAAKHNTLNKLEDKVAAKNRLQRAVKKMTMMARELGASASAWSA